MNRWRVERDIERGQGEVKNGSKKSKRQQNGAENNTTRRDMKSNGDAMNNVAGGNKCRIINDEGVISTNFEENAA